MYKIISFSVFNLLSCFALSQSIGVNLEYGISTMNLYKSDFDYIENGYTFSVSPFYEIDLNRNIISLNPFYRKTQNNLALNQLRYGPVYFNSEDIIIYGDFYGIGVGYGRENIFNQKQFSFTPFIGINVAYNNQFVVNKKYLEKDKSISIGSTDLKEYKTDIELIKPFYLSSYLSFRLSYKFENITTYLYPKVEYQLNQLFDKEKNDYYILYNIGLGASYDF